MSKVPVVGLSQAPKSAALAAHQHANESTGTTPAQTVTLSRTKKIDHYYLIGIFCLSTAVFLVDLTTKPGVAVGILYVAPIMLTPWVSHVRFPFMAAAACTILAIIGLILSPGVNMLVFSATTMWNAVANRAISIVMIWAAAILTFHYRRGTEARLRLASIVESSHDAIVSETREGQVTTWNTGAEQMFGYTEQESIGQFITFIVPPDRLAEEEAILTKIQRGERIANLETVRRRKDGQDISVSLTLSPIMDRWGNLIGASKIVRDITYQKQMEILLASQNQKLARHAEALKHSNEDLEQFAYIASHDLQEPLRTIHGFTQLLVDRYQSRLDDQAKEFMGFVTDGAERMQVLIQDLLKYSRIQAQELKPVLVDTEQLIREILAQLRLVIEETRARITHDPLPKVQCDPGHFRHLLQNLITNALKFHGPHPPRVHITGRESPDEWQFTVQDQGIGIGPEYHERIFLPFKRLHTREEYRGTGIGLAICKKIIDRRGGRIWVDSEVGKGSTFTFTLPK